ncbi:LacI family DNA-binding transcriptional regulator [bacterium 1XD8-76]|nr:LacI family DNA-binding transcriptional regulator [bacterium 1XD8-76]
MMISVFAGEVIMATIKEIAELAGVSRGTVDRVLNNRGSVNRETAEKIRAIIKQLDYKPNPAGIALAAQKKKYLIGIILFSRKNPFFDDVMQGFSDKAEELSLYGCQISVKRVAYHPEAQLSAIKACLKEGVQGLIITPYNDDSIREELNKLIRSGVPVITVNSDAEGVRRLAYVGSDYYNSGQAAGALMKLVTSGPVNLGIINGDNNILCHIQRVSGFVDKLSGDTRFKVVSQGESLDDDEKAYELVSRMLEKHPDINAFYFTAAGVYGGCRAIAKFASGRDIKVVTFDEVPSTVEMMQKEIITATICQEPYWQGSKSLELMFACLSDEQAEIKDSYYAELSVKIKEIV